MNPWSTKRKILYVLAALAILFVLAFLPIYFFTHRTPTCHDGLKNGDEVGVDCGGKCQLLCSFESLEPVVQWSRVFKTANGVYSAVAYIQNPNINSEALAQYVFKLYDVKNVLIATKANTTIIPKNKILAIFEPNIDTAARVPARVTFEFVGQPVWRKDPTPPADLAVTQKILSGESVSPRIDATVENRSTEALDRVEAVAIVYNDEGNAIAASRTFVDRLEKDQAARIAFTWPLPFMTSERVCRVPAAGGDRPEALGVMLAIDRSGSMNSAGLNPPQPLTDVKNAAISFIKQFKKTDQVGVVSFASTASSPVDAALTTDYAAVIRATEGIAIQASSTQYTNIADGLEKSWAELSAPAQSFLTNRAIVLLTDGVANLPEKKGDKDFPEIFAKEKSDAAKKAGAEIFTIGLGQDVNSQFLAEIASGPDHFFSATSSQDLLGIYDKIAVRFCKTGPSVVEIIPRVVRASW